LIGQPRLINGVPDGLGELRGLEAGHDRGSRCRASATTSAVARPALPVVPAAAVSGSSGSHRRPPIW
jgi:hypothetical protein